MSSPVNYARRSGKVQQVRTPRTLPGVSFVATVVHCSTLTTRQYVATLINRGMIPFGKGSSLTHQLERKRQRCDCLKLV